MDKQNTLRITYGYCVNNEKSMMKIRRGTLHQYYVNKVKYNMEHHIGNVWTIENIVR